MRLTIAVLTALGTSLAVGMVLGLVLVTPARGAERFTAAKQSAPEKTAAFKIRAQPLAEALIAFSHQSGLQVNYQPELAIGKSAAPVTGNHSPEQALKLLLGNTGLSYRFTDVATVTLERAAAENPTKAARRKLVAAQEPAEEPAITLPQITVQDSRESYAVDRATTATKVEAPLMDIPQSIQVVPRQVIEDQRAVNLSDVLRNISGFSPSVNSQSQRFGERDAIFRGFTGNNYYTNGFLYGK
jgi:iron complex outermembrane receptor protein